MQFTPKQRKDTDWSNVQPSLNSDDQMCCSHPKRTEACDTLTFQTKSAWANHHNRHSRPYVCLEPACVNLLGFTYSGGLLRHQREVHKAFGGPKAMLMCPYPYCKRNTGKGFTRKENLNEHVRRCHGPSEELAADGAEGEKEEGTAGAQASTNGQLAIVQEPAAANGDMNTHSTTMTSRKRRRLSPPTSTQEPYFTTQDAAPQLYQEEILQSGDPPTLDPALSIDQHNPNMFTSVPTQDPLDLKVELKRLSEQNALLQRQRAYLTNIVQEKDKQIEELQQELALFTGTSNLALSQQPPYSDDSQLPLHQQQEQQQHEQPQQQSRRNVECGEDRLPHPRLLSQFGVGINWAQSAPKAVEMRTEG